MLKAEKALGGAVGYYIRTQTKADYTAAEKQFAELILHVEKQNQLTASAPGSEAAGFMKTFTPLIYSRRDASPDVAKEVNVLVHRIATASFEQSQGLTQMTTALAQIDTITPSNANDADYTALASREFDQEAVQMGGVIKDLQALIGQTGTEVRPVPPAK